MKHLIACLALAATMAAASAETELTPYVGGRVVARVTADTGFHLFSAPDDRTSWTYQWPGVYFEARFQGDAVDLKVDDGQNNLYVFVDGAHKLTLTRPGRTTISLKDLGPGAHTVRLEKASETQSTVAAFDGFFVADSDDALPPPRYDRAIEFVGDSYTVGYGDTSRGQVCTVDDVRDTTDTSLAFAPAVAKHFGAAYRIDASSGYGVVRNYGGKEPGNTLPVLYRYTLFDKSVPADDSGWSPGVVVVGLGTNDFSTALGPDEQWATREALRDDFVRSYAAFVQSLRAKYPAARIILMASTGTYANEIIDAVNATGEMLKQEGVVDVEVLPFGGLDYQSCHGHPSLKDEAILENLLIGRISQVPGFAAPAAQP
jgi:hypothetical protein